MYVSVEERKIQMIEKNYKEPESTQNEDKEITDADLDHILVLKESGEEQYSISDSDLKFDMKIQEDGSLAVTKGTIETAYFIQNSQLEVLKSWRYELHNVVLTGIHVDAAKNTLTYDFVLEDPEDFPEYTTMMDEEEADG